MEFHFNFNLKCILVFLLIFYRISLSNCLEDDSINDIPSQPNKASSDCVEMLSSFAIASGNFTYCTIRNARPITLCQKCVKIYLKVRHIYTDITELKDRGGESCKDELFNLDRLHAVDAAYKYVTDLWARASCDSCFVLDPSGNPTTVLTNSVQHILNASNELSYCINKYHNDSIIPDLTTCEKCQADYSAVNFLYNSMKADNGDINYCMDIIDLINATRSDWSGALGCCNDRRNLELIFLLSSAGVTVFTILFYLIAFAFTKRKEHEVYSLQNDVFRSEVNTMDQ